MTKSARRGLGDLGERLAAEFLRKRGYVIIERNYRCSVGEIDLVARDGDELVFVEVRTRRGQVLGSPEESVTAAKQRKLIEVAETYRQEHQSLPESWRIDVVAVQLSPAGKLERIDLIRNAVTEG
jgi:putative endonuclease